MENSIHDSLVYVQSMYSSVINTSEITANVATNQLPCIASTDETLALSMYNALG